MQPPTAVVLAAGEGQRLRPLTKYRPKPMLPVATKPILERVFDQLIGAGITDIVVVVGYRRNRVQSHFGPTYGDASLTYVTQEKQLGTGHALAAAESEVDGTVLVLNGDQIADETLLRDVISTHDASATVTLGLLRKSSIDEYGGVILEDGIVNEIVESPRDDREYLLNAGVYAFEPDIFDMLHNGTPRIGERLLIDAIMELSETGHEVRGVVSDGFWVDATYPWDLLEVSFELFDGGLVDGGHAIDASTEPNIHETAVFREPVIVDGDCEIGPGAVVGPYACIGENTIIESNAVVKRSVLDSDTRVNANATVIDCVTGVGVQIGAGSSIPGGPGDVRVGNRVFEDEPLGALLADRVRDRGGVHYLSGSIVGPESVIYTGSVVRGTISEGTEVQY
ncbi:sugar phosphate nucleotidyltransferase [Natrialbaceae archaeon A-CW1-1]